MSVLPAKLPNGWRLYWDSFPDIDGKIDDPPYGLDWMDLNVDLLYVVNTRRRVLLDLDWIPEMDPKGRFHLRAVSTARDGWHKPPLRIYRSRSLLKIRSKLEDWLSDETLRSLPRKKPNKAPEPTSGTVTPRAEPRVAPVPPVAHL